LGGPKTPYYHFSIYVTVVPVLHRHYAGVFASIVSVCSAHD